MSSERIQINNQVFYDPKHPKISRETDKVVSLRLIKLIQSYYKGECEMKLAKIFRNYLDQDSERNYDQVLKNHLKELGRQPFDFEKFTEEAIEKDLIHRKTPNIIICQNTNEIALYKIDQSNLKSIINDTRPNKFEIEDDLQFSMINVFTGKCGSGKTKFFYMLLKSNSKVDTMFRTCLVSIEAGFHSDKKMAKIELDFFNQWLSNKEKSFLDATFPFIQRLPNIKLNVYFQEKENSPQTYSHLFFLLQYVFHKTLEDPEFLSDLNLYLKSEKFIYALRPKNDLLFLESLGKILTISELSIGERLEMYLLLLNFVKQTFEKRNSRPNFRPCALLLDEIDSNCDPCLIKKTVDGLKLLADYFKIQIFTSTHNPATISFLSLDQLYRVEKRAENDETIISIRKAKSKGECIAGVVENILLVNEPFKEIFVEGAKNDDKQFYTWVLFEKIGFGQTQVIINQMGDKKFNQYFKKLQPVSGANEMNNVFGINDGDSFILEPVERYSKAKNNQELLNKVKLYRSEFNTNLHFLNRYTLENYLYDPIYIYFVLKNQAFKLRKETKRDFNFVSDLKKCFQDVFNEEICQINDENKSYKFDESKVWQEIDLEELVRKPGEFKVECQRIVDSFGCFIRSKIKASKRNDCPSELTNCRVLFDGFKDWFYSDDSKQERIIVNINLNMEVEYDPVILFHKGKGIQEILVNEFEKISVFKNNKTMLTNIKEINSFVFYDIEQMIRKICETKFYIRE